MDKQYQDPLADIRNQFCDNPTLVVPVTGTPVMLGKYHQEMGVSEEALREQVTARDAFHWNLWMPAQLAHGRYNGIQKWVSGNPDGQIMLHNHTDYVMGIWERHNPLVAVVLNTDVDAQLPEIDPSLGARASRLLGLRRDGQDYQARKSIKESAQLEARTSWGKLSQMPLDDVREATAFAEMVDPKRLYDALTLFTEYGCPMYKNAQWGRDLMESVNIPAAAEKLLNEQFGAMYKAVELYAKFLRLLKE